jgi:hypothetical protein
MLPGIELEFFNLYKRKRKESIACFLIFSGGIRSGASLFTSECYMAYFLRYAQDSGIARIKLMHSFTVNTGAHEGNTWKIES